MNENTNISTEKSEEKTDKTMNTTNNYKNSEGYSDPTAGKVMQKEDRDLKRFRKLLETIFALCELSGFHLEGRITVRDVKSGRVWK